MTRRNGSGNRNGNGNGNGHAAPEVMRAAIYTRQSVTRADGPEFGSLDAQRAACEAYIAAHAHDGWRLLPDIYTDAGLSGGTLARPAFQRLLADVEARRIDVVVVQRVDRLSRSLLDFAQVMRQFNDNGVAFVSVTQNFSTADAMGKLTLNMLMSFAEFEREMTSERTRDKIAASRRRGSWTGGVVPLGFDVVEKKLVVNDFEAVTVRELFDLYEEHGSAMVVADLLNARSRTNKGRKVKDGRTLPGNMWDKDAVTRVVRSPIYAGLMGSNGETFVGVHQGIIDPDRWHRIVAVLDDHVIAKQRRPRNQQYLLRGLLHCGSCGHAMTPASTRKDGSEYRYYRCTTRDQHGKKACPGRPLSAQALEDFVVRHIRETVSDGNHARDLTARLQARVEQQRKDLLVERAGLPLQVAAVDLEAQRATDALLEASGAARQLLGERVEQVVARRGVLQGRLASVDRAIAGLEDAKVEVSWISDCLEHFDAVWDAMTVENRARLVRAIVDEVTVNEATGTITATLVDLGDGGDEDGDEAAAEPVSRPVGVEAVEVTP